MDTNELTSAMDTTIASILDNDNLDVVPQMSAESMIQLASQQYVGVSCATICREITQNSLDANSTIIKVYQTDDTIEFIDNGTTVLDYRLLITLGKEGSKKSNNDNTIGGFGYGLKAIWGSDDWTIQSSFGKLTGNRSESRFHLNKRDIYSTGTIVQFTKDQNKWYEVLSFLQGIKRDNLQIFYNDVPVIPYDETIRYNGYTLTLTHKYNDNCTVRINGLPSFYPYSEKINIWNGGYILDFEITESPQSENYPLTLNRDGFKSNSNEFKAVKTLTDIIAESIRTERNNETIAVKQESSVTWRGKQYFLESGIQRSKIEKLQLFDNYAVIISTYERYCNQVASLLSSSIDLSNWTFGLSDNNQAGAWCSNSAKRLAINFDIIDNDLIARKENKCKLKGYILALAEHELAHIYSSYEDIHNETFSSGLTIIIEKVNSAIFSGDFRV
jgi:hypothetical protein